MGHNETMPYPSLSSQVTAGMLRMISVCLGQLEAVQAAAARAEFAGLRDESRRLERETDQLERQLDAQCLRAFATAADPRDLNFYLMVFRSLSSLERAGDYALRVATELEKKAPRTRSSALQDVLPMMGLLTEMLELLAYALTERDIAAARRVQRLDFEQVDALYEQMQLASLTRLRERPEDYDMALTANHVARSLERLGDHIVNVAERLERFIAAEQLYAGQQSSGNNNKQPQGAKPLLGPANLRQAN